MTTSHESALAPYKICETQMIAKRGFVHASNQSQTSGRAVPGSHTLPHIPRTRTGATGGEDDTPCTSSPQHHRSPTSHQNDYPHALCVTPSPPALACALSRIEAVCVWLPPDLLSPAQARATGCLLHNCISARIYTAFYLILAGRASKREANLVTSKWSPMCALPPPATPLLQDNDQSPLPGPWSHPRTSPRVLYPAHEHHHRGSPPPPTSAKPLHPNPTAP